MLIGNSADKETLTPGGMTSNTGEPHSTPYGERSLCGALIITQYASHAIAESMRTN